MAIGLLCLAKLLSKRGNIPGSPVRICGGWVYIPKPVLVSIIDIIRSILLGLALI
jgi:hypothetical protein